MKKLFILMLLFALVFGIVSPSMVTQAEELNDDKTVKHEQIDNLDITIENENNTTVVTVIDTVTNEKNVATYNSETDTLKLNNKIVDNIDNLIKDGESSPYAVDPGAGYETNKKLVKLTSGRINVKFQDEVDLLSDLISQLKLPIAIATTIAAYLYNKLPSGVNYWSWYRWSYPDPNFPKLYTERLNELYFYKDSARTKLNRKYTFTGNFG